MTWTAKIKNGLSVADDGKPHTLYEVVVTDGVSTWRVWRRYSAFDDLVAALKAPGALPVLLGEGRRRELLRLPAKKLLAGSSRSDAVVAERVVGLSEFLGALLAEDQVQCSVGWGRVVHFLSPTETDEERAARPAGKDDEKRRRGKKERGHKDKAGRATSPPTATRPKKR